MAIINWTRLEWYLTCLYFKSQSRSFYRTTLNHLWSSWNMILDSRDHSLSLRMQFLVLEPNSCQNGLFYESIEFLFIFSTFLSYIDTSFLEQNENHNTKWIERHGVTVTLMCCSSYYWILVCIYLMILSVKLRI